MVPGGTLIVVSGHQADSGSLAAVRFDEVHAMAVDVERVAVHADVREAQADAVAEPDEERRRCPGTPGR